MSSMGYWLRLKDSFSELPLSFPGHCLAQCAAFVRGSKYNEFQAWLCSTRKAFVNGKLDIEPSNYPHYMQSYKKDSIPTKI